MLRRPSPALLALCLAALAWQPAAAETRPNLLFLFSDDQRPDTVAALGNDRIRTPHLDALAARGMVFTRATCSYPICVVSRAELLAGRHGWELGVAGQGRVAFPEDTVFLPQALAEAGYRTWHVGKWHVSGRPSQRGFTGVAGLFAGGGSAWVEPGQEDARGFPVTGYRGWVFQSDDGKERWPELGVGLTSATSAQIADFAISLIESAPGDAPWFCHVNFTAPHDPLFPPPGLAERYPAEDFELPPNYLPEHPFDHGNFSGRDEALLPWPRTPESVRELLRDYYAVIDDLDTQTGRILAALEASGQLENTLVIYSSDHGMGIGSHGLQGKQNQYEHTINVPFLAAGPGVPAGGRSEAQIYLRDLYPTLCEIAGAAVPDSVTALSFLPALRGERPDHRKTIHGYFTDTQRMIRRADGWKLIRYPQADRWQLFHLPEDPHEIEDLSESSDPVHRAAFRELRQALADWRREQGDPLKDE